MPILIRWKKNAPFSSFLNWPLHQYIYLHLLRRGVNHSKISVREFWFFLNFFDFFFFLDFFWFLDFFLIFLFFSRFWFFPDFWNFSDFLIFSWFFDFFSFWNFSWFLDFFFIFFIFFYLDFSIFFWFFDFFTTVEELMWQKITLFTLAGEQYYTVNNVHNNKYGGSTSSLHYLELWTFASRKFRKLDDFKKPDIGWWFYTVSVRLL